MSKKSILQSEKECFMCGTALNLEHHQGKFGPHQDRGTDLRLRRFAQSCYEDKHSREEWMEKIGRNYL